VVRRISLRRADHSFRGVLPSMVCLSMIEKSRQWGVRGPVGVCYVMKREYCGMELFAIMFNLLPEYLLVRLEFWQFPYLVEFPVIKIPLVAFLQFITLEGYCGITFKLNLQTKNWNGLKGNFLPININTLYMNTNISLTTLCAGSYGVLIPEVVRHFFFSLKLALIMWTVKPHNKSDIISATKLLFDFHGVIWVLYKMSWGQKYASRNSENLTVLKN
jgi:hypothetical protein